MRDVRAQVGELNRQLSRSGLAKGGRLVMFIGPRRGEGVSSIATSAALEAAERVERPAWLVDLDIANNALFNEFAVGSMARTFGGVGKPYSACLRQQPFFAIRPSEREDMPHDWFTAHRIGDTRLMVTQFDSERLKPGQSLQVRSQPAYWAAVRDATDWTVVDAPAPEVSTAGLAIAGQMDNCVIVARAGETPPDEIDDLRAQLEAHGGKVTGVVLNRMKGDALLFDRLWRGLRR